MTWPEQPDGRIADGPPDPYAIWAAATRGAYLASPAAGRWRLAMRLRRGSSVADLRRIAGLTIPTVYPDHATFCTAETAPGAPTDWQAIGRHALVLLAEPGMARPDTPSRGLDPIAAVRRSANASGGAKPRVVIGVIDGACGFAHRHFRVRDADGCWRTRLIAYWDQQLGADGSAPSGPWQCPPGLGYGRELNIDAFDRLLENHLGSQPDDDESQAFGEKALYRELGVERPAVADWSHGTHVLDAAGGWPPSPSPPIAGSRSGEPPLVPKGRIADAGLAFVQLPEVALRDTSGRWIGALVLDGIRYILDRAGPTAQVVINLSLAAFAGPHDGSSMIEQAIDALIDEYPDRLTVVVAAGNAAMPRDDGDGTLRCCHAEAVLGAAGSGGNVATLKVDIDRADATETFVELWLPEPAAKAGGWPGATVELMPPDTKQAIRAAPGTQATWRAGQGAEAIAMVVNLSDRSDDAPRGRLPMVLVAIGSTLDVAGQRAPAGTWRIRVTHHGPAPVALQAWIERRDVPGELAGERPQYGFLEGRGVKLPMTNTLGSLANGRRTIVVGGAEPGATRQQKVMPESSTGPAARIDSVRARQPPPGPLVHAPGKFTAAGFLTGSRKTLQGTSMAAAWVTRLVAARLLRSGGSAPGQGIRAWLSGSGPSARSRLPSTASAVNPVRFVPPTLTGDEPDPTPSLATLESDRP